MTATLQTPIISADAGGLVVFTPGVSADHQLAVLNSVLLAALNSDKQFNRNDNTQLVAWYANYTKVLQLCGWNSQSFEFQKYSDHDSPIVISKVILGIVSTGATDPEVQALQTAMDEFMQRGTDDPSYKAWDNHTRSASGVNMQIVAVTDDRGARNSLAMRVSALSFTTSESTADFLRAKYDRSSMQLQFSTQIFTLNEDVWDQVRDDVATRLQSTEAGQLDHSRLQRPEPGRQL